MGEGWVLPEFPGDVTALGSVAQPTDAWLAITPTAIEELDGRGIPYRLDGEICPPEQLNRIGEANFYRTEALSDGYDQLILRHCPAISALGFLPFRGHFSRVKFFLDAVTIRLHILQRLLEEGAQHICKIRSPEPHPTVDAELFYGVDESVYEDLLDLLAHQASVEVRWVPGGLVRRPPVRRPRLKQVVREVAAEVHEVIRKLGRFANGRLRSKRILCLGVGYDLRCVLELCRQAGAEVFWLDRSTIQLRRFPGWARCRIRGSTDDVPRLQAMVQHLELFGPGDPAEALCREGTCSYAPLVRKALAHYVREGLPRAIALHGFLAAAQRQLGFDIAFSPSGPERIETRVVFDFCRQAHIPIATVQHGLYGHADNPVTNYGEFGFDGDFLTWGPGVEAHYGTTKQGAVRFITVGSPTLDELVVRRPRSARRPHRVMYITTDLRGASAYFPGGQVALDTTYYCFQKAVLRLLERYQEAYECCLKIPPTMDENPLARSHLREWLWARGSRIQVEDRPLVEVINEPGLFLIDFPSTTLLQCLATRAEVIVFTGSIHCLVLSEAHRLLAQRAVCCETPDEFLATIEAKLRAGLQAHRDGLNDAFLRYYGTCRHDGGSLYRIRAYLESQGIGTPPPPRVSTGNR